MIKRLINLQIPSVLGIILLIAGLGGTSYLAERGVLFQSQASSGYEPQQVSITNLSENTATIAYVTKESVSGTVTFGETPEGKSLVLDDRDKGENIPRSYSVHHITLTELSPNTTYYFSIVSQNATFRNNGTPYTFTTASPLLDEGGEEKNTLSGTLLFPEKSEESLVFMTAPSGQLFSGLVNVDGSYALSLRGFRTADMQTAYRFNPTTPLTLKLMSSSLTSQATISSGYRDQVPPILLGNNYNFTLSSEPIPLTEAASSSALLFPTLPVSEEPLPRIRLLVPEDKQFLSDTFPRLEGTLIPGETGEIELAGNTPQKAALRPDRLGRFTYRPVTPLELGEYTVKITTRDSQGEPITLSTMFTIVPPGTVISAITPTPTVPTVTEAISPIPLSESPSSSVTAEKTLPKKIIDDIMDLSSQTVDFLSSLLP